MMVGLWLGGDRSRRRSPPHPPTHRHIHIHSHAQHAQRRAVARHLFGEPRRGQVKREGERFHELGGQGLHRLVGGCWGGLCVVEGRWVGGWLGGSGGLIRTGGLYIYRTPIHICLTHTQSKKKNLVVCRQRLGKARHPPVTGVSGRPAGRGHAAPGVVGSHGEGLL